MGVLAIFCKIAIFVILHIFSLCILFLSYENIGLLNIKYKDMDKDDKVFILLSVIPVVNVFLAIIVVSIEFERLRNLIKNMFKEVSKEKHVLDSPVYIDFEGISNIVSELDSVESKAWSKFDAEHYYYAVIEKESTPIGCKYIAKCVVCGETKDITNYDNW